MKSPYCHHHEKCKERKKHPHDMLTTTDMLNLLFMKKILNTQQLKRLKLLQWGTKNVTHGVQTVSDSDGYSSR